MTQQKKDYYYLLKCLELACSSVEHGNHPFGSLIVYNDEIIEMAENNVITSGDFTGHAELNLVKKAQKVLSPKQLEQSTLYSSTEPCAMCAGAIYWAGIRRVVFGCSVRQLNSIVGGGLEIELREVFESGKYEYEIKDFSDDNIFQSVHKDFW